MRKSVELDHLLENAVAAALGVARPHPDAPKKLRAHRAKPSRRQQMLAQSRRELARAAA